MKRRRLLISFMTAAITYLTPYGVLKYGCIHPKYTPGDPWIGEYPNGRLTSNVLRWADLSNHWEKPDFPEEEITLNYRDPGYELPSAVKRSLNWIYVPVQNFDENLTRWAVRFRVTEESHEIKSSLNQSAMASPIPPRVD